VVLVRSEVSEEGIASIIRVTRIGELGTTLAVTSSRRTPRRKTPFFIVTAVKISYLTEMNYRYTYFDLINTNVAVWQKYIFLMMAK
jgi:hypothetical protein